jgi:hypothetical protein
MEMQKRDGNSKKTWKCKKENVYGSTKKRWKCKKEKVYGNAKKSQSTKTAGQRGAAKPMFVVFLPHDAA